MKKISLKTVMVITLLIASVMATPAMAAGYEHSDEIEFNQMGSIGGEEFVTGFERIMGGLFQGMGQAGNLLGAVFSMLLMQTLDNFSYAETIPNVYTLSASTVNISHGLKDFGNSTTEIFTLPYGYNNTYLEDNDLGRAYCVVNTTGQINYEIEYGAAVTLIIWDNDGSFITAVKKLVGFFNTLRSYKNGPMSGQTIPDQLISEGVELVTWFLIHINDIFTGEELFALNPITWQKITLNASADFSVEKKWKVTGNDYTLDPTSDEDLKIAVGETIFNNLIFDWNTSANAYKDGTVEWLLTLDVDLSLYTAEWTSFTFDLIQLWVKTFHIEIDASKILSMISAPNDINFAEIFHGVEIDFFLFTHHLAGAYLYNDKDGNDQITTRYDNLTDSNSDVIFHKDGVTPVQVVNSSEVTHKLMLGSVNKFEFLKPTPNAAKDQFSWGLILNDVQISPVPVGVDLESYLSTTPDHLDYISFGFTFKPEIEGNVLKAPIKLDQFFAPFNGNGKSNNNINDLDLAILYVSTMLHFHLKIDIIGENPEEPSSWLNENDDYYEETHQLKVGNYLGSSFVGKLDFVDIAGKNYTYGLTEEESTAPANSSILPIALYESETNAHETFVPSNNEDYQRFSADIGLNISFNVVFYAVTFPEFNGGNGIWHDPTFSVYMVFEAQGFWALILLIAGVGLVGVGTILIKRRKDARF